MGQRRTRTWVMATGVVGVLWAVGLATVLLAPERDSVIDDSGFVDEDDRVRAEAEDDRGPVEPEVWTIALDDDGIYSIHMIKTFSRLEERDLQDFGGHLVWPNADVELCNVDVRAAGDGFVQIGDIFRSADPCEGNDQMQELFDNFGPPQEACVFVRSNGIEDDYCAPLDVG